MNNALEILKERGIFKKKSGSFCKKLNNQNKKADNFKL